MHNHVGHRWIKTFLKQLKLASRIYLSTAIVLSPIFFINSANASTLAGGSFLSCLSGSELGHSSCPIAVAFLSCRSGSERVGRGRVEVQPFLSCLSGSEHL